jgi:hypothetical protein
MDGVTHNVRTGAPQAGSVSSGSDGIRSLLKGVYANESSCAKDVEQECNRLSYRRTGLKMDDLKRGFLYGFPLKVYGANIYRRTIIGKDHEVFQP